VKPSKSEGRPARLVEAWDVERNLLTLIGKLQKQAALVAENETDVAKLAKAMRDLAETAKALTAAKALRLQIEQRAESETTKRAVDTLIVELEALELQHVKADRPGAASALPEPAEKIESDGLGRSAKAGANARRARTEGAK